MTFLSHINDVDTKCKSSVITFGLVNGIVCDVKYYFAFHLFINVISTLEI